MPARLGQTLLRLGLVTREKLEEAVERQTLSGGRVGTNLLELGYITEEALVKVLSLIHAIPYAEPKQLESISPPIIALMPRSVAEKYKAIPYLRDKAGLHVAMANPENVAAVDELQRLLGCLVLPRIATESRIFYALEKYYQVTPPPRYQAVRALFTRGGSSASPQESQELEKLAARWKSLESKDAKTAPSQAAATEDPLKEFLYPKSPESIARTLITAATQRLKRVVLFQVQNGSAVVWRAAGDLGHPESLVGHTLPLDDPSLLATVWKDRVTYQGTFSATPVNIRLTDLLEGPPPQEALAIPIFAKEKTIVALLYGDNGPRTLLLGEFDDLEKLAAQASLALQVLILQKKIRAIQ